MVRFSYVPDTLYKAVNLPCHSQEQNIAYHRTLKGSWAFFSGRDMLMGTKGARSVS